MTYEEAIDAIEGALLERYNVRTLQGVGPLSDALAAARAGDLAPIETAIREREMYRWEPAINAALKAARSAAEAVTDEATEDEPEPGEDAIAFPQLAGTVADVAEWVASIQDAETLMAISVAEGAGKDRKGVHEAIDAALAAE